LEEAAKERAESEKGRTARTLENYAENLGAFRSSIVSTHPAGWLSGDEKLRENMGNIYGAIVGYDGPPTKTQIERTDALLDQLAAAEERFAEFVGPGPELDQVNSRLGDAPLEPLTREAWDTEQEKGGAASLALGRVLKPKHLALLGEEMARALLR
jgi:hypothetical protein